MSRPQKRTIKKVIDFLDELGLSVYGQNMDVDSGQEFPSLRYYDLEDIIKRYNHIKNDTLWRDE